MSWRRPSPATGARGCSHSSSSRRPVRPTPGRSIR
jgi:hypothetical protein